jgi:hypothetical protein
VTVVARQERCPVVTAHGFAMLRQQIDKRLVQVDDQAGAIGTRELQP